MGTRYIHTLTSLALLLRATKTRILYLSHEPEREKEAREFAAKLKEKGFEPLIAADFRTRGYEAVFEAIKKSHFTLVLAFDEKTVNTCEINAVPVIDMRTWET